MQHSKRQLTRLQHAARSILGSFMVFAGMGHLSFARQDFQAQVPNWLPFAKDTVVIYSGILEIALGFLALLIGHKYVWIPWMLSIFFIAVFPGNIAQYLNQENAFGLNSDFARLMRLFFQPILILWSLWSMGIFSKTHKV